MPYAARAYKVMIASPSDVEQERKLIREVINEWNSIYSESAGIVLMPVGWESHASPAMGDRPQGIINKQVLKGCDLLVAVFWTRIGSPTGKAISGTVEEIEEHIAAGKPAMIYFSGQPVRPDSVEEQQYRQVKDFKEKCSQRGIIEVYETLGDFRGKFSRQLAKTLISDSYFIESSIIDESIVAPNDQQANDTNVLAKLGLSAEAQALLLEVSEDRSGTILKVAYIGGFHIQTNGKQFVEQKNPRSRAAWENGLSQLCDFGLLEERGFKGEVYGITLKGYQVADLIKLQGK